MQKIKSFTCALLFMIAAAGLTTTPARATAILNVVGGQLNGARNVAVNGSFFDVTFLDGTCVALFNGCDQNTDFAFNTAAAAQAAGQALLDQVLLDTPLGAFDSSPISTRGCEITFALFCNILIPFDLIVGQGKINTKVAINLPPSSIFGVDNVSSTQPLPNADTTSSAAIVYAVFTPAAFAIPEPSTLLLFAVGLAGLAGIGRRRRRHAAAS